jgi:hypothetical protein
MKLGQESRLCGVTKRLRLYLQSLYVRCRYNAVHVTLIQSGESLVIIPGSQSQSFSHLCTGPCIINQSPCLPPSLAAVIWQYHTKLESGACLSRASRLPAA